MSTPIYNEKAERAVLGAVMRSADAFFAVSHELRAEHFYVEEYQRIFNVVSAICNEGKRLTPRLICARLPLQNSQGVAVESTVGILIKEAEGEESPLDYVEILRSDWKSRQLVDFLGMVKKIIPDGKRIAEEKLVELRDRLEVIGDETSATRFTTFAEAARKAVEQTAKSYEMKDKGGVGIRTGIVELDLLVGPIMPGMFISVVAPSGHGKTALLMQVLKAAASHSLDASAPPTPSLFVSAEMPSTDIARRVLAADVGIETQKQRTGDLTEDEFTSLHGSMTYWSNLPVLFDDRGELTVEELVSSIRRAHRLHQIKVVGFDNFKQLRPSRQGETKVQAIERACPILKTLAKELDITIIALAQITREGSKREGHWRPKEQDVYGGGAVKENSDIMLAVVLPQEWLKQHEPPQDEAHRGQHDKWAGDLERWAGKAEFGALKVRDGTNGDWKVVPFDGPRLLFGAHHQTY